MCRPGLFFANDVARGRKSLIQGLCFAPLTGITSVVRGRPPGDRCPIRGQGSVYNRTFMASVKKGAVSCPDVV